MRVLVCPTDFKESLDVLEVSAAMSEGIRRAMPHAVIRRMPVSDGGPGLLEALHEAGGGEIRHHEIRGPLGEPVTGRVLLTSAGEAVIESADACGLHLVPPHRRDPLRGDTRGVADLLISCLDDGASRLVIGLGGSGTVDGGVGMAEAFGYRFVGSDGSSLAPGGGALEDLARIERPDSLPPALASSDVIGIADVRTPLTGPEGAAATFGPQKGAGPEQVRVLERGLARLAARMVEDLGKHVADIRGSGAAGGLAAGCAAFLGADLVPGSDWVLDRLDFDVVLAATDLVVTGEGAFDATSGLGKIVWEIVRRSAAADVPVVLVCGRITGTPPTNVRPVSGGGGWLDAEDVARMVAEAAG